MPWLQFYNGYIRMIEISFYFLWGSGAIFFFFCHPRRSWVRMSDQQIIDPGSGPLLNNVGRGAGDILLTLKL